MAEPQDMVVRILRDIQSELAAFRSEAGERLDKLQSGQRSLRFALSGDTMLSRMLVGEYEERINALEKKVGLPEPRS